MLTVEDSPSSEKEQPSGISSVRAKASSFFCSTRDWTVVL